MTKFTSVCCNHTLSITNVQVLAEDLSKKLRANICYGYIPSLMISEESKTITFDYENYEFVPIGTIAFPNATETYYLKDSFFDEKRCIENYGAEILNSNSFRIDEDLKKEIISQATQVEYELFVNDNDDFDTLAYIYKNVVDLWFEPSLDWRFLQHLFVFFADQETIDEFCQWRVKHQKWVSVFGGQYMFVYSIEEQSAEVLDWFQELEEQRVFGKIKTQFKNKIVNIPNFILSKNYLSAPVYEPKYADFEWHKKYFYAEKHHIDLNPFDLEYPILFYDDFYDVSQTKICNKRAFDFVYNGSHVIENEKKNFDVQDKLVIERAIVPLPDVSGCSQLGCIFVAGYSHYHSMHLWFQLQLNQEVYLVIEPDNKFDKHAIAVYTDLQNDWEFNEPA